MEPLQDELNALPVKDRLEAIDRRRGSIHQMLNSVGILFGVVFTAASLIATALSVRATQRELQNNQNEFRNSQQGQITDRYTKAVDQLGSGKIDIRLGGIYALERLAADSPRDDRTVYDVLCAFVREHDPKPGAKTPYIPDTDIQAALTVIGRRKPRNDGFTPELEKIRTAGVDLRRVRLPGADLDLADLARANLNGANLRGASLVGANLKGADLRNADLRNARGVFADQIRPFSVTNSRTRF